VIGVVDVVVIAAVLGGGVVVTVRVFAKLAIFWLTKPTELEDVASFGDVAGRNEIGESDFRFIPETMFEICPLLAELIGIRCWFEDGFRLMGTVVLVILDPIPSALLVVVITRFGACFIVLVVGFEFPKLLKTVIFGN